MMSLVTKDRGPMNKQQEKDVGSSLDIEMLEQDLENKKLEIGGNYDLCDDNDNEDDDDNEDGSDEGEDNNSNGSMPSGIISFSSSSLGASSDASSSDGSSSSFSSDDSEQNISVKDIDIEEESDVLSETASQKEMSPFLVCKINKDTIPSSKETKNDSMSELNSYFGIPLSPGSNNSNGEKKLSSSYLLTDTMGKKSFWTPENTGYGKYGSSSFPVKEEVKVPDSLLSSSYMNIPSTPNVKDSITTKLSEKPIYKWTGNFRIEKKEDNKTQNYLLRREKTIKEEGNEKNQLVWYEKLNNDSLQFLGSLSDQTMACLLAFIIIVSVVGISCFTVYLLSDSPAVPTFCYDKIKFFTGDEHSRDHLMPNGKFIVDFDNKVAIPYDGNTIEYNFSLLKAGTIDLLNKSYKILEENCHNGYDIALELSKEIIDKYKHEQNIVTKIMSRTEEDFSKRVITIIQHFFNDH